MPISKVVVDANLAARAVLPVSATGAATLAHFSHWHRASIQVYAPDILIPETVSVIRQAVFSGLISPDDGRVAVEDVYRLGIVVVASDLNFSLNALIWSEKLGQSKAYDGYYLALASQLQAELWTGDQRLVNRSHQVGADWVHALQPE